MGYVVKEVFATLQGEGFNTGRVSVFCRFAGCNLWTGREANRVTAICRFCDTDFVGTDGAGGGHFADARSLAEHVATTWPAASDAKRSWCAPAASLCSNSIVPSSTSCTQRRFTVAIETNGTIPVPPGVDWVCVSPKADADLVVTSGDELKLVYPQARGRPERYAHLDVRSLLPATDGRPRAREEHRARRSTTA